METPNRSDQLRPIGPRQRILALDALRGVAIFGIFMVNIQFFAMPFLSAWGATALADAPLSEQAVWALVKILFEYKFISLFSLLFGAGLIVQVRRTEAKGRSYAMLHLRRMAVLALFGLVHALLLWYGDILLLYAVIGLWMLVLRHLSARMLLLAAGLFLLVAVMLTTAGGALQVGMVKYQRQMEQSSAAAEVDAPPDGDQPPAEEAPPLRGWEAIRENPDPTSDTFLEAEARAYREGPFLDAFIFRAVTFAFCVSGAIFSFGWHVLGFFALGAGLMKLQFFEPGGRRWQARLCAWGLLIGLPLEVMVAWIVTAAGHELSFPVLGAAVLHEVASVPLALGYAGGIALLASRARPPRLLAAAAAVGRLALSNYLLQTVVATGITYWWGLGLFGKLSRPEQLGVVLLVYAAQVAASLLWLRWFRYGPLEWLWRSLTYLRLQPIMNRPRGAAL